MGYSACIGLVIKFMKKTFLVAIRKYGKNSQKNDEINPHKWPIVEDIVRILAEIEADQIKIM